jgi:CRP/FNR family transcriptional regulator
MSAKARPERWSQVSQFLEQIPLFAGLSPEERASLAGDLQQMICDRGETIFRQGELSREIYLVVEGKVRIFKTSLTGSETSLTILGPGDVFGEFAAIDALPRSATAVTISPASLLQMTAEQLRRRLRDIPELAIAITRLIIDKTRWTAAYAESMVQYDAAGRLLQLLLLYQEQFGRPLEPGGPYLLDLSLNQNDLASLVGARREWVNHLLRRWREQRLLEYHAGKIVILDLARVEAERDQCIRGKQISTTKLN